MRANPMKPENAGGLAQQAQVLEFSIIFICSKGEIGCMLRLRQGLKTGVSQIGVLKLGIKRLRKATVAEKKTRFSGLKRRAIGGKPIEFPGRREEDAL